MVERINAQDDDASVADARARWALVALSLSMLLSSLGTSVANVGLPALAEAFAAPFQAVQWVVLAYLLAVTALIVGAGRLGDAIGRRRLLVAGIALFTAASLACAAAPTLWLLVAARAAQGAGAAAMMALTMALVGEAVPKARTGAAMGLLGTMSAVGTALGPSLGGVLISGFGWRSVFMAIVLLGVLAVHLAGRHLPADAPSGQSGDNRPRFDWPGTFLLASTLAAYALAMTVGRGHVGTLNLALFGAALVGGVLFMRVERTAPAPLVRPEAFRDTRLGTSLIMNLLVATVIMATFVVGPFFLSRGLGLDDAGVGAVLAIGPVVSTMAGVPAGRLVDRLGASAALATGLALMTAGCLALSVLPYRFGVAGYGVAIAILTPGYQLFQAANNTAVMLGVPADRRGVVSGMLNLSRNLGLVTGASLMGAVFVTAAGVADAATAPAGAIAAGMRGTFLVAAGMTAAALVLAVRASGRDGAGRPS